MLVDAIGNDECVLETGYSPLGNVPAEAHTDLCLLPIAYCLDLEISTTYILIIWWMSSAMATPKASHCISVNVGLARCFLS